MGLRIKNFNILGVHWIIQLIGGEFTKNWYRGGGGGAWTVFRFKWGLGKKERGGVFEGGDTPMHTMNAETIVKEKTCFKSLTNLAALTYS